MFRNLFVKKKALNLGKLGEDLAQKEYKRQGYKIVDRNFFNRKGKQFGEVDFIVTGMGKIIFVEVKTRSFGLSKFGSGFEAVNFSKQAKLLKIVHAFLSKNVKFSGLMPQIDVCVIEVKDIDKSDYNVKILSNAVEDWN